MAAARALTAAALATVVLAGCGGAQPGTTSPPVDAGVPQRGTPGELVFAQSGCLACHRLGRAGNHGPGPTLTHVGSRMSALAIERVLIEPRAPMPSFRGLPARKRLALVAYLSQLR